MAVKQNELLVWILAGIGVATLIYFAQQNTGDQIVPPVQKSTDAVGLGLQASSASLAIGTNLDTSCELHGWHPGYDPDPHAVPVVQSRHRYPAIPGGNLSTVMHHGWSRMSKLSPADSGWETTPPEAAIL